MKFMPLVCAAAALALATPATAQNMPVEYGDYVEVTGVDVLDGGGMDYATWLATAWRKNQDYAKQQGWITGYEVLSNLHPREGEPDIYILVRSRALPDAIESARRDEQYRAYMKTSDAKMQMESANRGKFRKVISNMLLGEVRFKR